MILTVDDHELTVGETVFVARKTTPSGTERIITSRFPFESKLTRQPKLNGFLGTGLYALGVARVIKRTPYGAQVATQLVP